VTRCKPVVTSSCILQGKRNKEGKRKIFNISDKVLSTSENHKGLFQNFKGMTHPEDLKRDPTLCRDDRNRNIGSVLSPRTGSLMEAVEKFTVMI
jgi:hypothetical protein